MDWRNVEILEISGLRGKFVPFVERPSREQLAEEFLVANTNTKGCLDAPKSP